jgi:hypothetical protein
MLNGGVAKYEVGPIKASYKTPNWHPEGPQGWSFSVTSDPVDGGAPHRRLLDAISAAHPHMALNVEDADSSGYYLEGSILWQGAEIVIWAEALEGFLYIWSLEREPIEAIHTEAGIQATRIF